MSLREHVSLREHACVSSRGAQSTELVWILDFKQILLLLLLLLLLKYYYYYYALQVKVRELKIFKMLENRPVVE